MTFFDELILDNIFGFVSKVSDLWLRCRLVNKHWDMMVKRVLLDRIANHHATLQLSEKRVSYYENRSGYYSFAITLDSVEMVSDDRVALFTYKDLIAPRPIENTNNNGTPSSICSHCQTGIREFWYNTSLDRFDVTLLGQQVSKVTKDDDQWSYMKDETLRGMSFYLDKFGNKNQIVVPKRDCVFSGHVRTCYNRNDHIHVWFEKFECCLQFFLARLDGTLEIKPNYCAWMAKERLEELECAEATLKNQWPVSVVDHEEDAVQYYICYAGLSHSICKYSCVKPETIVQYLRWKHIIQILSEKYANDPRVGFTPICERNSYSYKYMDVHICEQDGIQQLRCDSFTLPVGDFAYEQAQKIAVFGLTGKEELWPPKSKSKKRQKQTCPSDLTSKKIPKNN